MTRSAGPDTPAPSTPAPRRGPVGLRPASARNGADRGRLLRWAVRLLAVALAASFALPALAQPIRVATWGAELSRKGPGLLLRDLLKDGKDADPEVAAVVAVLAEEKPDVLLLTDFDWDLDGAALSALADRLAAAGLSYPHRLALPSNAGLETALDLDGDGTAGTARDAQGYGRFPGQGALALLSRYPLGEARDLSSLLWRDLPGARLPGAKDGTPFPSAAAQAVQRLSSTGHWIVPVETPGGTLTLMAWAATPPVFDGPEDLNGLRNADELALWSRVLDGDFGPPPDRFVILGDANLDPADGEGRNADMAAFLADARLQDPRPASDGAKAAADPGQRGDPALDTADWDGPGNLRTSYVLPAATLRVTKAGVVWPKPGDALAAAAAAAGPQHLVWVDLAP